MVESAQDNLARFRGLYRKVEFLPEILGEEVSIRQQSYAAEKNGNVDTVGILRFIRCCVAGHVVMPLASAHIATAALPGILIRKECGDDLFQRADSRTCQHNDPCDQQEMADDLWQ